MQFGAKTHPLATRLLALAALVFGLSPSVGAEPSTARRPNIVVIVADDQGYAEAGCYGNKDVPTPHMDALARGGIRFTDGYVSCPVCSPTRAGLMTGRYQQRFGHEFNVWRGAVGETGKGPQDFGLPLSETTLADCLKAKGYATGIFGKWHLGHAPQFHPLRRGFDEFYGFLRGAHAYLKGDGGGQGEIQDGNQAVDEEEYLTDTFTRKAVAFIDSHRQQPFFLYLAYNAVHGPLQATAKYYDRFPKIDDPKRRTFAAMLSALDDGVGAVLGELTKAGLEENTLVFFISDNGGPTRQTTSHNDPLRGFKGQVLEGGIRIPYMVQWKGQLPAGKTYAQPVISLDILPTAVAAAGGKLPEVKLDGVNLLPYLKGEKAEPPHEALFWRFGQQSAVRKGQWKLVKVHNEPVELYDLAADIGESRNLAEQKPEVVKELEAAWKQWDSQLEEPRWKPPQQAKPKPPGRKRARAKG